MSSDDRLRELLENLRPPGGFDVDGDLAAVRRRGTRRARGRALLAAGAVVALLAGTVAVVAAVRNRDGGSVAGGGGPVACVPADDNQGPFTTFATGSLPNGQHYELRSRGEDEQLAAEVWVNGNRVVNQPFGQANAGSVLLRTAQIDAIGGTPLVFGRAPIGRSVRLTSEDGQAAEYPLIDGPGGRRWFVGVAPTTSIVHSAEVVGTDGKTRDAPLLSNLPECVGS